MIYLDNSATTKPNEEVMKSFHTAATHYFGNPSSLHGLGMEAERLLRKAREQIAELLQINPDEVVFTSGGTEGNNLAIKGIALQHQHRGRHIIASSVEHPSVIESLEALKQLGFHITYIPVDENGRVNPNDVKKEITDDTILVSVMHVNNEIGTIQPIEEIGALLHNYPKIFFHVDAVQSIGKVPISIRKANIDLCTISGHKIHGLKGTGILYVKKGIRLFSLAHGGGQEANIRSGTENVPGIVALAKALRITLAKENDTKRIEQLKIYIMDELKKIHYVKINTPETSSAPHIVHFSLPGFKPEVVIHALEEAKIYISTKSACSSKKSDISSVLEACGKSQAIASSGLRVSMSFNTTKEEIDGFLHTLNIVINKLAKVMR
ncbi:cysteine desulfurase family protein [Gracilibacillus marinus]|jgi:cysteine desulfurase|uniref:Cysteine desulfurase family protein n=1 Tax=Gracilibacillus marinus TaxID=630535 RepID=A0ABV8VZH8_9BACI